MKQYNQNKYGGKSKKQRWLQIILVYLSER